MTAGDREALGALASNPDLPEEIAGELRALAASDTPGADSSAAARLSEGVTSAGDAAASEVRGDVRQAFARAMHRIYSVAVVLMAVAVALAFRIPELPLRKTHDRVVVAE